MDFRPERAYEASAERSFVFPVVIGLFALIAAAAAVYFFTRPTVTYAISASAFSRLDSQTKTLAVRLNEEPCNRDIAARLAKKLADGAEYAATISFVEATEAKCGPNEYLWIPLANAQRGSSDYAAAEATVARGIALHPDSAYAYFMRADLRTMRGDFDNAYVDYKKAIYIYSDLSKVTQGAFQDMAKASVKLGKFCDGISIMQDYIALHNEARHDARLLGLIDDWQKKGACPPPFGNGKARLAYDQRAPGIILPVTINGVTGKFVIDTGASRVTLTKDFARRAAIRPDKDDEAVMATANGEVRALGGRAKSIALGNARAGNVPIYVHTARKGFGPGIDGLLGLSFLGNFKVTLSKGQLILEPLA